MGSGNAASYWREALIEFALIIKPVCGDHDLVNLALPLPYKTRSGLESPACIVLRFGIQSRRNVVQFRLGFRFQAPMGYFLDSEGKDRKHQFSAKTRRCWTAKALLPEFKQASSIERWQLFK